MKDSAQAGGLFLIWAFSPNLSGLNFDPILWNEKELKENQKISPKERNFCVWRGRQTEGGLARSER